eukprot:Skav230049  [mRNA]  locus=scaffold1221:11456:16810:+ [translate_table: standard]
MPTALVARPGPGEMGHANTSSPVIILQNQVPSSVSSIFEQRLQSDGLCLSDLAMLAALLEDLVHRETMHRVSAAFRAKRVPMVGKVSVEKLGDLLDYVMMSYILEVANLDGTNLDQQDVGLYLSGKRPMEEVYPNWPKTQKFLRDIQGVVAPSKRGSLSFDEITHVVEEIHEHYGRWHDEVDCQEMKQVLWGMERCPGREDYLRDLGALDTSLSRPSVVVSNYVLGASNCIGTSRFYAQCCVDPCDQMLAKLEKALAAPEAPPAAVAGAGKWSSVLVNPVMMWMKALAHDGQVVLHGRLFAQWLHHAYPQECPMPPALGLRLQQELPKDFSIRTGQDYVATEKEMKKFAPSRSSVKNDADDADCKLPWTWDEELLDANHSEKSEVDFRAPVVAVVAIGSLAALSILGLTRSLCKRREAARGPLLQAEAAATAEPAAPTV